MNGGLQAKTTGLVLDMAHQPTLGTIELSGSDIKDFSSHGNHGTPTDITTTVLDSGLGIMSFNGTTSKIDCGNEKSLQVNTNKLTVEFWFADPVGDGSDNILFIGKYDGGGVGWYLFAKEGGANDNQINWRPTNNYVASGIDLNDGKWHHLAISQSGTTPTLYTDGVNRGNFAAAYETTSVTLDLEIGNNTTTFYQFKLAMFRMYNYALSTAQVLDHYTAERWWFGV